MTRGRPRAVGQRRGGPLVDEQRLALRYTRDKWTIEECARRFGIGGNQARSILLRNNVELRPRRQRPVLDEDAVLRAYARHRSYVYVAIAMGTDDGNVRAILDKHGVPHSAPARPRDTASQNTPTRAGRVRPATGPPPADLLVPVQATQMPDVQWRS